MDKYHIVISKSAQKKLNKLPDQIAEPLIKTIQSLADNPRPNGFKKLTGRDAFRVRKGTHRIIIKFTTIF